MFLLNIETGMPKCICKGLDLALAYETWICKH